MNPCWHLETVITLNINEKSLPFVVNNDENRDLLIYKVLGIVRFVYSVIGKTFTPHSLHDLMEHEDEGSLRYKSRMC